MPNRVAFIAYQCFAFIVYLGAFFYALAFVGGFLVTTPLDGAPNRPGALTLVIDAALMTVAAALAYIVVGNQSDTGQSAVPLRVPARVAHAAAITARIPVSAILLTALAAVPATAQDLARQHVPAVPVEVEVEAGHAPFLVLHAIGTQNYICQSTPTGPAWRLFGPQAMLFHEVRGTLRRQVTTHYLSANPDEAGIARPTWQHSIDSSQVWGRASATSSDPAFVRFDAIPWLRVEVVGAADGTIGGGVLTQTTFIQRVNTEGGIADPAQCSTPTRVGATVLVPYEADYVFYRRTNAPHDGVG